MISFQILFLAYMWIMWIFWMIGSESADPMCIFVGWIECWMDRCFPVNLTHSSACLCNESEGDFWPTSCNSHTACIITSLLNNHTKNAIPSDSIRIQTCSSTALLISIPGSRYSFLLISSRVSCANWWIILMRTIRLNPSVSIWTECDHFCFT